VSSSNDTGGIAAISRWLSGAIPPVSGMEEPSDPVRGRSHRLKACCDPSRGRVVNSNLSGGTAPINHRLMALTLPGSKIVRGVVLQRKETFTMPQVNQNSGTFSFHLSGNGSVFPIGLPSHTATPFSYVSSRPALPGNGAAEVAGIHFVRCFLISANFGSPAILVHS
jgi:hypothetical protein